MGKQMKDSGLEWIGMIPKDWAIDKIKYHFRRNEPKNPGDTEVLSVYREYGVIPKDSRDDNHNVTSEDTSKYKYVKKGNLVINKMKAWQGSLAVSDYEGIVSPAYFIYEFTDDLFNKKYFHYLVRGCYKDEFRRLSGGIREGQWDLSADEFAKTLVIIPTIKEQIEITEYLDDKCKLIDGLIAEAKDLMESYKEYKQSIITETVTKGLNPDVEMKDSGIEWIGEIPEHWTIRKIKNATSLLGSGTTPSSNSLEFYDGDIYWIQSGDIYGKHLITDTAVKVTESAIKGCSSLKVYDKDFIIMAMYGGSVGNTAISKIDACVNQACCCIKPNKNNDLNYMFYWIERCKEIFLFQAEGGGQPNISQNKIKNQYYLQPPINEQKEIVEFLDKKCGFVDTLITEKEDLVEKLEEYKKSLIYEYVTGKKEVPA